MISVARCALAALALGASVAATPASAFTYANYRGFATHSYWTSFSVDVDGTPAAGVITRMSGGKGSVAVLVRGRNVALVLDNDKWQLDVDSEVPIEMVFGNGRTFRGVATAKSTTEIAVGGDRDGFVRQLMASRQVTIMVNGVTWTLDLTGFTASFADALDVYDRTDPVI
jgi:hypothetical protein